MGNNWDAIFVGAGITTLACAALLVRKKPTLKLLILDKHIVTGGYASAFHRPKVDASFDCSLHKLSGMGEGGNLSEIFEELGLYDEIKLKYPTEFYCSYKDSLTQKFSNTAVQMQTQLCQIFPQESDAINTFFAQVETYGRNGYYQFQMMDGTFEANIDELRYAHKNLKNITVEEGLNKLFSDPYLIELLAAPGIYVGGYPEDLGYLYYLHVVYATLNKGNAYVVGSSQLLSDILAKRVIDAGGQVLLSTPVTKINVNEDNIAIGVETKKGTFKSSQVYINTSPHYALDNLFDEKIDFNLTKSKLKSLKPARSTLTVYAVTELPPEELGLIHSESMVFSSNSASASRLRKKAEQSKTDQELNEYAFWHNSPMEVTNYHLLDPNGGNVLCLNILDHIEHWPERRTVPYREKKARAGEVMLQRLYEKFPQLEGRVKYTEVATPRTYVRFTNNTDGSGYGAMIGTDLSGHSFHHKFPVKGVDFISAWVAGPSYEAAFGYAKMKASSWRY